MERKGITTDCGDMVADSQKVFKWGFYWTSLLCIIKGKVTIFSALLVMTVRKIGNLYFMRLPKRGDTVTPMHPTVIRVILSVRKSKKILKATTLRIGNCLYENM